MSDQIIKVIDALAEKLGIAVDWTAANIIPYLQTLMNKYISYAIATDYVWIVINTLLVGSAIVFGIHYRKMWMSEFNKEHRYSYDFDDFAGDHFFQTAVLVILSIAALIATLCLVTTIIHLIKCYTIPELVMFNYLKGLTG